MDGWMDGWMDAWMHGWMDGWVHGWMDACMDEWMRAITLCPLSSSHICRWLLENLVETIIIGPLVTVCGRYLLPRIF